MRTVDNLKQRHPKKTSRKRRKEINFRNMLWFKEEGQDMMNELFSVLSTNTAIRQMGNSFHVTTEHKGAGNKEQFTEWLDSELLREFELGSYWTDGKSVIFIIRFI